MALNMVRDPIFRPIKTLNLLGNGKIISKMGQAP